MNTILWILGIAIGLFILYKLVQMMKGGGEAEEGFCDADCEACAVEKALETEQAQVTAPVKKAAKKKATKKKK